MSLRPNKHPCLCKISHFLLPSIFRSSRLFSAVHGNSMGMHCSHNNYFVLLQVKTNSPNSNLLQSAIKHKRLPPKQWSPY